MPSPTAPLPSFHPQMLRQPPLDSSLQLQTFVSPWNTIFPLLCHSIGTAPLSCVSPPNQLLPVVQPTSYLTPSTPPTRDLERLHHRTSGRLCLQHIEGQSLLRFEVFGFTRSLSFGKVNTDELELSARMFSAPAEPTSV